MPPNGRSVVYTNQRISNKLFRLAFNARRALLDFSNAKYHPISDAQQGAHISKFKVKDGISDGARRTPIEPKPRKRGGASRYFSVFLTGVLASCYYSYRNAPGSSQTCAARPTAITIQFFLRQA